MEAEENQDFQNCSNLIGLIYDAAQTPELWPELLDQLNRYLDEEVTDAEAHAVTLTPKKELLEPHFLRASDMNRRLHLAKRENSISSNILNRLPIGVIITNSDAIPVAINERANRVLEEGQTLRIKGGKISTNSIDLTRKLHQLIQKSSNGLQKEGGGAYLSINDHKSRNNTSIWITSSSTITSKYNDETPLTALYITSPLIRPEFNLEALQQSYKLTSAEALLVKSLANGCHDLNEVADKLGLSINTVRTQSKRVFKKTGSVNQMELIKKVLTDPSVLVGKHQQAEQASPNLTNQLNNIYIIKLNDGRNLSYAEYGDPEGRPVFMFHGIPGSRLLYPAEDTKARELGLRIIIPDRPGMGLSDLKKNRTLLDWPNDLTQLADNLGFDRFSILSSTGGGAYAMACAHTIPERIKKLSMVSACGPVDSFSGTLSIDRTILRLARYAPALLTKYIQIMFSNIARDPIKMLEKRYKYYSDVDKQCIMDNPNQHEMYAAAILESARQGAKGIAEDLITVMKPWGFQTKELKLKARLWYGIEDRAIPVWAGRQLAGELPDCKATFVPNIGSMVMLHRWDEILTDLAEGLTAS